MKMFRPSFTILVALLSIPMFTLAPHGAVAQTIPGQEPGIVAIGFGRASSPATSANVQVIVGQDYYGGAAYAEGSSMVNTAVGSPVPDEVITPGWAPYPMGPPALTEEDLASIIDAITSAGVPREQIQVIIPAFTSMYVGPGGPGGAQLLFSIADPTIDGLTALVNAVSAATTSTGLSVQHIGVAYLGADCDSLQQAARVEAVVDAQKRAEGLAAALGATLGDLTQAADSSYFGSFGPSGVVGCEASVVDYSGPYGEGTLPPFNPTVPAEAVTYAQVTLTFTLVFETPPG